MRWCFSSPLTGEKSLRAFCAVTIARAITPSTTVQGISSGVVVISTTGTTLSFLCGGLPERRITMTGGVYHIGIPAKCRIQGVGFAISGMARRSLRITVQTKTITVKPFHLVSTVTQHSVARHFDSPHWAALGRVENIRLASFNDTPDDTSSITWGSHVSHVSWATMIIVMCIIVVLICVKVLVCAKNASRASRATVLAK